MEYFTQESGNWNPLIFMGLKHSGKTSLGVMTAKELGFEFKDLDHLIMETAEKEGYSSIRELYRSVGIERFQNYESSALQRLFASPTAKPLLLSLGGGTVENPSALQILRKSSFLVYLSVEEEVLFRRIEAGGIPPFLEGDKPPRGMFHELFLRRDPLYRRSADLIIELQDLSVQSNVRGIISRLKEENYVR